MRYTNYFWPISILAAATFTAIPASAQLGLGRATGTVGGTVSGAVGGTVQTATSGPAVPAQNPAQNMEGSLRVTQNAALSTKIGPLLPSATTLPAAAAGFRSDSEFLATLHAAHNLNIPFEQLKEQTTGKGSVSLSAAIRKLRPDLDSKDLKDNLTLAQHQSERDMDQASSAATRDRVASHVTSNDRLAARLNPMVPSGQTLPEAAAGFRNEDQFMSTLHAANDNGLAFGDLKDRVTAGQSLSTAIHDMKPSMDANSSAAAAAKAETESKDDKVHASASASAKASVRD